MWTVFNDIFPRSVLLLAEEFCWLGTVFGEAGLFLSVPGILKNFISLFFVFFGLPLWDTSLNVK